MSWEEQARNHERTFGARARKMEAQPQRNQRRCPECDLEPVLLDRDESGALTYECNAGHRWSMYCDA